MSIKAIETVYKGIRFRSRLEARWAVFFDKGRIRWKYETEGFATEDGTKYLPDFYLPDLDIWVEVKPDTIEGRKEIVEKVARFIQWGGPIKAIIILSDIPEEIQDGGLWHFPVLYWRGNRVTGGWWFFFETGMDQEPGYLSGGVTIEQYYRWYRPFAPERIKARSDLEMQRNCRPIIDLEEIDYDFQHQMNGLVFEAIKAARMARFEHGERG